jgi:hypothetical protein
VGRKSASQLPLRWRDRDVELPEAIEEEVRALLAQLLRAVVEAERDEEESEGE